MYNALGSGSGDTGRSRGVSRGGPFSGSSALPAWEPTLSEEGKFYVYIYIYIYIERERDIHICI